MTTLLTIVPTRQWSEKIPPDIALPEKDITVLSGAIAAHCEILTTGDCRRFGPLYGRTIGGTSAISDVRKEYRQV